MKKIFKGVAIVLIIFFIFLNVVVAVHAYKFTHFYDNAAASVKKPELMSGWEETEALLFGINYSKLPLLDSPAHPFQKFYTKTTDGIVLKGWYVPRDSAKGTVILFHGHGGNRGSALTEANGFYNDG